MQPDNRTHGSISAALAAANAALPSRPSSGVRFPAEDGGRSLAEMAQRDLDAALQLLADRAQYITGANGAAIALRRGGKKDLLCRARIGPNAPELGALLSSEFGLSGESVRTRKALHCDDADRDARVNREVCRQLGIASVVVMPVVHDDEVLGVFELFSGKAHAFGERDISALERLSEMVETAVRLARAAEQLPEPPTHAEPVQATAVAQPATDPAAERHASWPTTQPAPARPELPIPAMPPKKRILWSAPVHEDAKSQSNAESDHSAVPPVLRGLGKCEACGFPISAGRSLCVECEEKRWRGQLKRPQTLPFEPAAPRSSLADAGGNLGSRARSFSATAAQAAPAHVAGRVSMMPGTARAATAVSALTDVTESKGDAVAVIAPASVSAASAVLEATPNAKVSSSPAFSLSAGLERESWLSANKYIFGAILVIAATVAAILFLR